MKLTALLSWMLLMTAVLQSQVIVQPQLPPSGLTIKPQLWNLSLINSGSTINVQIEITLTDIASNQLVLTGTTKVFPLSPGAKQILASDVQPVTYIPGSAAFAIDPGPDGFLPVGIFNICFTVTKLHGDAVEKIGQECMTVEVEPLSPPQLVIPANQETIELTRPLFTWLPPSPLHLFNNLRYDWLLVEVTPLQSPADALQQNIPVLTQQNIALTNFQYPLSMQELDTAKRYAWRITAKNGVLPIANSETWVFTIKKPEAATTLPEGDGYFAKLRPNEDAAYVICQGILRYEYLNEINDTTVRVHIIDITDPAQKPLALDQSSQKVRFGQNFLQLDLRNSALTDKHLYRFQLTNAKEEKWLLKFEYRKPNQ